MSEELGVADDTASPEPADELMAEQEQLVPLHQGLDAMPSSFEVSPEPAEEADLGVDQEVAELRSAADATDPEQPSPPVPLQPSQQQLNDMGKGKGKGKGKDKKSNGKDGMGYDTGKDKGKGKGKGKGKDKGKDKKSNGKDGMGYDTGKDKSKGKGEAKGKSKGKGKGKTKGKDCAPPPPPPVGARRSAAQTASLQTKGSPLQKAKAQYGGRWDKMTSSQKRAALAASDANEVTGQRLEPPTPPSLVELAQSDSVTLAAIRDLISQLIADARDSAREKQGQESMAKTAEPGREERVANECEPVAEVQDPAEEMRQNVDLPQKSEVEIERDSNGDTAMHHLCRNNYASVEMLQLLLDFQPDLVKMRNRAGNTPLMYLLRSPASVQKKPTFDMAQHSDSVELLADAAGARCIDQTADIAAAAANVELSGDGTWQFTLQAADDEHHEEVSENLDEVDDAGISIGASTGSFPDVRTWLLKTQDGQLYSTRVAAGGPSVKPDSVETEAPNAEFKVSPGDTIKFTLSGADVSININGIDHGPCFQNVQVPIRPYVHLTGSKNIVKLGPMTLIDGAEERLLPMICALITSRPEMLHTADIQNRLPVHVAYQNQAPRTIQKLILEKSLENNVVWCGEPRSNRPGYSDDFGIHVALHALDRRERDSAVQEAVFDVCLAGISSDPQFRATTSINGLPFDCHQVSSVTVSKTHIGFLLRDGRVFRVKVKICQKRAEKPAPEMPEKLELREVQLQCARHQEVIRRKKKTLDEMKKANYGVDESEIQMLVEITAKSKEECRMVARRIKAGPERLELAMNILMGFAAMNSGGGDEYLLGDDVGKSQYEYDQELRRIAPYERRLRELNRIVRDLEKRQQNAAKVYKPETLLGISQLQEWTEPPCKFSQISSCLSHLLALGVDGILYAWCWRNCSRGVHRRATELCNAKITTVVSSCLRTSVLTQCGKVASWMDDICQITKMHSTLDSAEYLEDAVDDLDELLDDFSNEEISAEGPTWDISLTACHQGNGTWELNGRTAEISGGSNYCIAVATVPFPSTGQHTCRVRAWSAPENMAVGVVTSFEAVCKHTHTSKGWLGNGPSGWCLFKDGDAAHGGSWKGGNYGDYAVSERSEVSITFNADQRTISFEVNGKKREDVYGDLPESVYLAVSLYKNGKVELMESDFTGPAPYPSNGRQTSPHEMGPEQLLFGEGAGKIVEVSSEDGSRTAENLRNIRVSSASAAWVSKSHEMEHVVVDFGDVFQVTKLVLKPYYSKKYAIKYREDNGVWKDYQHWNDAAEGDDVKLIELKKIVYAKQMKLMVDKGRRSSWKVFNVHGRSMQPSFRAPVGWLPYTGPTVLDGLEHRALHFDSMVEARIVKLAVSDHGTAAVCANGRIFWWGCRPWTLRQSRLKAMARDNSASVFAKLYEDYKGKFSNPREALSRAEMVTLIAGPNDIFQQRLSEVGDGSDKAELMLELHEVYSAMSLELRPSDTVILCDEDPPMYQKGSMVIANDVGVPALLELAEDIQTLKSSKVTFRRSHGGVVQLNMRDVLMLSSEQTRPKARILQVDPHRGIVIVERIDNDGTGIGHPEIVSIVDVSPRHHLYEQPDSVQVEPLPVMAREQLLSDSDGPVGKIFDELYHDYVRECEDRGEEACQPSEVIELVVNQHQFDSGQECARPVDKAYDGIQEDADADMRACARIQRSISAISGTEVPLDGPDSGVDELVGDHELLAVSKAQTENQTANIANGYSLAILKEKLHAVFKPQIQDIVLNGSWEIVAKLWDGSTVYRFSSSLSTAEWKLESTRCCNGSTDEIGGKLFCIRDEDALVFEVDEQHYMCSAAATSLPPLHFCGAEKLVARKLAATDTMPTATAVIVMGFQNHIAKSYFTTGFGGRNELHNAVHESSIAVCRMINTETLSTELPSLLVQQDSQGRTPFFTALSLGNLDAAAILRAAVENLAVSTQALLAPDFYGNPPIHALLGLRSSTHVVPKLGGDSEMLLQKVFSGDLGQQLLQARDSYGNNVLQSYMACGGKSARSLVLRELLSHGSVVRQCVSEDDDELDAFVCALLRSSQQEPILFCKTVVENGKQSGSAHLVAKRFIQSCVRVFVTLCSTVSKGLKSKHETMMAMFEVGPLFAIPVLAEMADDVMEGVRLGFPLSQLEPVSLDSVNQPDPKGKHKLSFQLHVL
eukprot:SAG31_NODE_345_length_17358_cov_61.906889_2_plen_2171_part_00